MHKVWILAAFLLAHDSGTPYADWMTSLMQPGRKASCCGVADQYWVTEYAPSYRPGVAFVAVVQSRDGNSTFMMDVPEGTVLWNSTNPTGRGVIFIQGTKVLCFVPGTGA